MKKVFLVAAMAAAVLSSCSKNEIDEAYSSQSVIGFDTFTGIAKGTEVTTSSLGTSGFGVLAYYHEAATATAAEFVTTSSTPNFMYNQQVTYSGSAWIYSPVKYWPNDTYDRVSFFAYGPYTAQTSLVDGIDLSANTVAGIPYLNFSIASTASEMVDFVVATPKYEVTKTYSNVSFTFDHMLTRLKLSAWTSISDANTDYSSETKVVLTDAQIVGATNSTLMDKDNSTAKQSSGFYSMNKFTFATKSNANDSGTTGIVNQGVWDTTSPTDRGANYPLASILNLGTVNNANQKYSKTGILIPGTTTSNKVSLFKTNEYVFLLPPDGNTGIATGTNDVLIYVAYDIVTKDDSVASGYSLTPCQDIIALPAETLKAGVSYNIILEIALESVKVNATVEAWATDEDEDIYTPETNS